MSSPYATPAQYIHHGRSDPPAATCLPRECPSGRSLRFEPFGPRLAASVLRDPPLRRHQSGQAHDATASHLRCERKSPLGSSHLVTDTASDTTPGRRASPCRRAITRALADEYPKAGADAIFDRGPERHDTNRRSLIRDYTSCVPRALRYRTARRLCSFALVDRHGDVRRRARRDGTGDSPGGRRSSSRRHRPPALRFAGKPRGLERGAKYSRDVQEDPARPRRNDDSS